VGEVEDIFETWTLSFTHIPGQTKTFSISRYFPEPLGISEAGGNIDFSEPTTRLSLLNIPAFELLRSNKSILRTCLVHLSSAAVIIDDRYIPMDQIWFHFPLTAYVVSHLMDHARESGTDQETVQLLMDFFQSERTFNVWVRLYVKAWPPLPMDSEGIPSPLWIAVSAGLLDVVRKLAEGVDLNTLLTGSLAVDEGTPLMVACRFGHSNIAQFLIETGSNVNAKRGIYGTALQTACFFNHTDIVRLLLEKGALVNTHHGKFGTALQIAVASANTDLIRLLVDKGADVNAVPPNEPYDTPLQVASRLPRKDIVILLLECGAEINLVSLPGDTALACAVTTGNQDLIRYLISRGAGININGGAHCAALWEAPEESWLNILEILLDEGADLRSRNQSGSTSLHMATAHGAKSGVELLLQRGAEVNPRDKKSLTPLSLASELGHTEIWHLLKAAGGTE
jgi:ankyrin repeat protein